MHPTNCPDQEVLNAYLLGTLPPEESDSIARHLAECAACDAKIMAAIGISDSLRAALRQPGTKDAFADEPECRLAAAKARALRVPEAAKEDDERNMDLAPTEATELGQIGPYQLIAKLGEGGMGAVYKAIHSKLKKTVAIKILPEDRMKNELAVVRFQREMEAVGQLEHPNLVRATDAGEQQGKHFLVMECVDGVDLSRLVKSQGSLAVADACELVRQAAVGLQHAHEHGLVHRDIKPSNLILATESRVKIVDFGLALLRADQSTDSETTSAGFALGTVDYMAPEQASDSHNVDVRADIYSLGCTLYKLLTGHAPFSEPKYRSVFDKLTAHAREPVPPIEKTRPDMPEGLIEVIGRMLAKDPDERFATPAELAEAILPFTADCDLPALLTKAGQTPNPLADVDKSARSTDRHRQSVPVDTQPGLPAETQVAIRRWMVWQIAVGLLVAIVGVIVVREIVMRITEREVVIHTPEGDTIRVRDGKVDVTVSKRPPMSRVALVTNPAQIQGVDSWTIETRGHRGEVLSAACSPDGRILATGCEDGTIRLWDPETGRFVKALVGHDGAVDAVSWAPDSRQLASGSRDHTVRVWDVASGRQKRKIAVDNPSDRPVFVAFSPDGKTLAYGGGDAQIHLWDVDAQKEVGVLRGPKEGVRAVAWSPDGKMLAAAGGDRTVRVFDIVSREVRQTFQGQPGTITAVAISPDDRLLASTSQSPDEQGGVRVWGLRTGKPPFDLPEHPHGSQCVAFSPDGKTLVTGGAAGDGRLRAWDVATRKLLYEQEPDRGAGRIASIAVSPDGRLLAVAHRDGTVELCELRSGRSLRRLPKARKSIPVSPDGQLTEPPKADGELFYVVRTDQGQTTLTPQEFAERYERKGDGKRVARALDARPRKPPAVPVSEPRVKVCLAGSAFPGILPHAASLSGLGRWQVETVAPRNSKLREAGSCMDWSPDGKFIACGTACGNVRIYDARTLRLDRILIGHAKAVTCLAWSPDSQHLASGSHDHTIRIWASDGTPGPVLKGHTQLVSSVAWSPDGRQLATGGFFEKSVRLWEVDGTPGPVLEGHASWISSVAWSPDGQQLASASWDCTVRVWSKDGVPGPILRVNRKHGLIACVDWSPDGTRIAAATRDGKVQIWNTDGTAACELNGHAGRVASVAWSPDGQRLASAGADKTVRLWKADGTPGPVLQGHTGWISSVAWSPDGSQLASFADDGLRLWKTNGEPKQVVKGQGAVLLSVAWNRGGTRLAAGGSDNTVRVWTADGAAGPVLRGHTDIVSAVAWSPDGNHLASGGGDNTVRLWESDGTAGPVFDDRTRLVTSLAWRPQGHTVAFCALDNRIRLWNANGMLERVFAVPGARALAWDPNGQWLASGGWEKTIRLWRADGTPGPVLQGHTACVTCLAWSPDGRKLASISDDGEVRIWEASGRAGPAWRAHNAWSFSVAWGPEGRQVVTCDVDGTLKLWSADGTPGPVLEGHTAGIESVAWFPNRHQIASAGGDGRVILWDPKTGEPNMVLLPLRDGNSITFNANGDILHGDPETIERELIYLVQNPAGQVELLKPSEFNKRVDALRSQPAQSRGETQR